jgi:hypothetical protein
MQKLLPVTILLLIACALFAQPDQGPASQLKWGAVRKESSRTETIKILGAVDDFYYFFNRKTGATVKYNQFFLDVVGEDMQLIERIDIKPQFQGKSVQVESAMRIKKNLYITAIHMDKQTKTKRILAYPFDTQTRTLARNPIEAVVADFSDFRIFETSDYDIEFSIDSSWFVINYTLPRSPEGKERFAFQVFDSDFKPIWGRTEVLDYPEKLFEIVGHRIDDEGDVYVLGRLFAHKKVEVRNKKVNYEYRLIGYRQHDSKPYFYDLDLERSFPGSVTIIPRGREIICMGFYSDVTPGHAQGCFAITFEKNRKQLVKYSKVAFDLEFIAINLTDHEKKKLEQDAKSNRAEIPHLEVNGLILREDQSIVVVAEQHFIQVGDNSTRDQKSSGATHYYKDIVVFALDPKYKIDWYEKIPKRQVTRNDGGRFSSFHPVPGGDRIYFLYNDQKDNFRAVRIGLPKTFKGQPKDGMALVAQMELAGSVSKHNLYLFAHHPFLMQVKMSDKGKNPSEIVMVAVKGRRQIYGRMQLDAPATPGRWK